MINPETLARRTYAIVFTALLSATVLTSGGCDSSDVSDPGDPQFQQIVISPDSATFAAGEQFEFSAFALTTQGDTVDISDLEVQWQWLSSDSEVFTVEPGGIATGHSPGQAYCIVEATILDDVSQFATTELARGAASRFTGRDSAFVMVF